MSEPEQSRPESREQATAEPEAEWVDPETRWKRANEAWLQARWRLVLPAVLAAAFVVFILPWVFLPFLPALAVQLGGCVGFYLLGKRYTTAFDR
jgi:hypothetical protein